MPVPVPPVPPVPPSLAPAVQDGRRNPGFAPPYIRYRLGPALDLEIFWFNDPKRKWFGKNRKNNAL